MAQDFDTRPALSSSVGSSSTILSQQTIQKQTNNSFADKLAQGAGTVTNLIGNGANTVASAIGFRAGQVAASGLSEAGMRLAQFGTTNPANINTQVHGLSNAQTADGAAAVATGPGASANAQPSFGAGTSGGFGVLASAQTSSTANVGQLRSNQSGPAFGAGAIGLDGSSGLTGGIGGSGGGLNTSTTIGAAAGGDSSSQLMAQTQKMQEVQMSFNLQYLQLQSQMQAENRNYSAVSNIMKTKHETVKNSIGNIR